MDELKNALRDSKSQNEIETEVEKVINSLKLPFEMIRDVENNPLHQDEEASIAFLASYRDKVIDLTTVYDRILWDYRQEIEEYEASPEHKAESLLFSRNKFSDELQNIIDTMRDNSIKLCMNGDSGEINACYYESVLHSNLIARLHYHTNGYVHMIAQEPYLFGSKMKFKTEDAASHLN